MMVKTRSMQVWVKLSKTLSSLARNRNRRLSCSSHAPLVHGYCHCPGPLSGTHTRSARALTELKCEPRSCQCHVISSHLEIWLSRSQEALGSTTVSTSVQGSEGLELLRQHELAAAVHVVHHLLFELCHLLPEHVGRRCQL